MKFFVRILPYLVCILFFIAYSTLSVVRHDHYQSFGFDLGINDQITWEYSKFKPPITTIDHIPFISKLDVHIETVYPLLSPLYWIWSDPRMLLILQAGFVCFSGLAVYFLAKRYRINIWIQFALLFSYLTFYGVQNALWFDVHSATFAAAFTAWFIYCLVTKKTKLTILFFVLAITGKENVAGTIFLISVVYYFIAKDKKGIYFSIASLLYLAITFGIYFPNFVEGGYRFEDPGGLFSNLNPLLMINTPEKLQVYWYTFLSYGFLSLLNPLYLIPVLGNLASYFILGASVTTAQGLFLQYRIVLAPLMSWATILIITKHKWLNKTYVAVYLVMCVLVVQYVLHLPLSYLAKQWFWGEPQAARNIDKLITYLPNDASVVSQNNITPHISERSNIFTLWPATKNFVNSSPCQKTSCNWFRWSGNPQYLIVDTSSDWDARHLLENIPDFVDGLKNLEQAKIIERYKVIGNAKLFKIMQQLN